MLGSEIGDSVEGIPMFTGTSINGDFGEALRIAIADAKRQLNSTLVSWQLANLTGVHGGFAGQTDLTVAIYATVGGELATAREVLTDGPDKRLSYHTGYLYFAFGPRRTEGKGTAVIRADNNGTLYGTQLVFSRNLKLGGVDGWVYKAFGLKTDHQSLWFASTPNPGETKFSIKHKKLNDTDDKFADYVTNAEQTTIQN